MAKLLVLAAIVAIASGCASHIVGSSATRNLAKDNDNVKAAKAAANELVASVIQCRYIMQTATRSTRVCMQKTEWEAHYKRT